MYYIPKLSLKYSIKNYRFLFDNNKSMIIKLNYVSYTNIVIIIIVYLILCLIIINVINIICIIILICYYYYYYYFILKYIFDWIYIKLHYFILIIMSFKLIKLNIYIQSWG